MEKRSIQYLLVFVFTVTLSPVNYGNAHNIAKRSLFNGLIGTVDSGENSISNLVENTVTTINSSITNAEYIIKTLPEILAALEDIPDLTEGLTLEDVIPYTISALTNEDVDAPVSQLIEKYGYKSENYTVETEDGYILTLIRIPGDGKPLFLMHGILESCDDFVTSGNETGLAFILAAQGYDVWMGNARGNKHSRDHKNLTTHSKEYWNFSWHEIGVYDLPAMIDCVLKVTNHTDLVYIGHSQGTTTFFVMGSERPEYNKKVSVMISLATVAWMGHIKSPLLRALVPFRGYIAGLLYLIGEYEISPNNVFIEIFKNALCTVPFPLCNNLLFLINGFSYNQIDTENFPVEIGHLPGGSATRQLLHYAQEIDSGEFRRYDHGDEKNMELYGSQNPPSYSVENITAPIYFFHTYNDWLSNITDVQILRDKIPNEVGFYEVPLNTFNHLDYLFAKDKVELVYGQILKVIKEFTT